MAAQDRRADSSLKCILFRRSYEFDFFQAVHLLARIYETRKAVGQAALPAQEIVRFRSHGSMGFPASQIHRLGQLKNGQPVMTVAFLGLTGPQGILPSHYTEALIERKLAKDYALADFLDIFNHRLISLFYRSWEKHHFPVGYEREHAGETGADRFTSYLFALINLGTGGLRNRLPVRDLGLLRYAGLIAQQPHSASALRSLLSDYFQVPVEIDQLRGKWLPIEDSSLSYLDEPGPHNQLGLGAIAGDAVWDQQSQFRVRIGPVTKDRFVRFLPDRDEHHTLRSLVRYFAGDTLEFEVQLILKACEVPACQLTDETADAPRLGWLGWLKTEEFERNAGDAVFSAERAA